MDPLVRGEWTVFDLWDEELYAEVAENAEDAEKRGMGEDEEGSGVKNVERGEENREPSPRPSPIRMGEGGREEFIWRRLWGVRLRWWRVSRRRWSVGEWGIGYWVMPAFLKKGEMVPMAARASVAWVRGLAR